uniref:Uncharacterized protein n=1 Tax=Oryza nivara TaxID=4536 RepID=A0A0E0H3X0_ORYNI
MWVWWAAGRPFGGEDPMTERGLVVVAAGPTGSEPCRPGPAGVPIGEGNVTYIEIFRSEKKRVLKLHIMA